MFNLLLIVFILFFTLILFFRIRQKKYFISSDANEEKYLFFFFSVILFTGVLLRIISLNFNSYWIDELFSIDTALMKSASDVISECREDVHPPLYMLILHFYVKIAGDSEMASRLLSAVFGIISIAGFYMIANLLFNSRKALAMMMMFSIAYLPVYYSQESRSYSLLLMFVIFTNYFFLKAFIFPDTYTSEVKKIFPLIFYSMFSLMMLFTHYYGIPVIIFNFIFLVYYQFSRNGFREFLKKLALYIPVFILITSVFYIVWGHIIFYQYQRTFWPQIGDKNIFSAFTFYVLNPNLKNYFLPDIIMKIFSLLMLGFFIFYLAVTVRNKFRSRLSDKETYVMLFIFFWLYIPFIVSYIQTVYSNPSISFRNLIILSPAVIIVFYVLIEKCINFILYLLYGKFKIIRENFSGKNLCINPLMLAVILSILMFAKTYGYYAYPSKQDIRGMVKEVSEDSELYYKNPVIFTTSKTADQLNYYFRRFSPELKIKSYLAGESLPDELIKFRADIESHDYLVLFDIKNWGKDSEATIDYFKSKYNLISEKESDGFSYYIFNLKKPLL